MTWDLTTIVSASIVIASVAITVGVLVVVILYETLDHKSKKKRQ